MRGILSSYDLCVVQFSMFFNEFNGKRKKKARYMNRIGASCLKALWIHLAFACLCLPLAQLPFPRHLDQCLSVHIEVSRSLTGSCNRCCFPVRRSGENRSDIHFMFIEFISSPQTFEPSLFYAILIHGVLCNFGKHAHMTQHFTGLEIITSDAACVIFHLLIQRSSGICSGSWLCQWETFLGCNFTYISVRKECCQFGGLSPQTGFTLYGRERKSLFSQGALVALTCSNS